MSVVLYGKHPGFGDFLSLGIGRAPLRRLEAWLQDVLPTTRDMLGADWDRAWETAPDLRFWIGPDVLGIPFVGIWQASVDRVGRQYPLMLGLTGPVLPPPVHAAHDDGPYIEIASHLADIQTHVTGQGGAQSLVSGFDFSPLSGTPYDSTQGGMLWGMRGDGDLARLFRDAVEADAYCAQYGRSHWWHAGTQTRELGWLSVNGLPDAQAMRWLLTERVRDTHKIDAAALQKDGRGSGQG